MKTQCVQDSTVIMSCSILQLYDWVIHKLKHKLKDIKGTTGYLLRNYVNRLKGTLMHSETTEYVKN